MFKVFLVYSFFTLISAKFEVPNAKIEVFHPRGLKVSIPHVDGIKLFAFHAKINEELYGREGGTISRDITKTKDNHWIFYDPTVQLKIGDTLYYWTYVDYDDGERKLGYTKDDQEFKVTQVLDKKTGLPIADSGIATDTTQATQVVVTDRLPEAPIGCEASVTVSNGRGQCADTLIFHDDFDRLNPKFWRPEIKFAGSPDYEFVLYQNRKEVLIIEDDKLKIRPVPSDEIFGKKFVTSQKSYNLGENCTGVEGTTDCVQEAVAFLILPPVTSAQISTKTLFSFKYGKIEIRAKLPKGDWIYPELYLNSLYEDYGPEYQSGQIRIAFLGGNADLSKSLYGGCILSSTPAGRHYAMKNIRSMNRWNDDFHIFTVFWYPNQITMSVDNKVYGNIFAPEGGFASLQQELGLKNVERLKKGGVFAPFDKEMYLSFGVGVGGHCFEDRSDGSKPWVNLDPRSQKNFYHAQNIWSKTWNESSSLEVDYVKIWSI